MKNKKNMLEQLKMLPHFTKKDIYQLAKHYKLADSTIDTYISRFLRHKEIITLKNGLYVSAEFFEKNRKNVSYSFYMANILRIPSYISSWTALQYYDLATEAIYSITSVTSKVTRSYTTKAGDFTFQSMRNDLFSDFVLVNGKNNSLVGGFDFYIASPSKALFDMMYFRTKQFRGMSLSDIMKKIEELRVDFDEMEKSEQEKFYSMIKKII